MKRKRSLKAIRRELDDVFSLWIRRRDANEDGYGNCISCGKFTLLQCGHFQKRQHKALRWDERAAAGQCVRCNHFLDGNEGLFAVALVEKYGQQAVVEMLARKHETVKLTREWLEERLNYFKSRL